MKARFFLAFTALHAISACSGPQSSAKALLERPGGEGSVVLTIEGVASNKGLVYGSIYTSADGFPDDKELAFTYTSAPADTAEDGVLVLSYPSIPAGWIVVAVLHDKDGDEELSFNKLGIPSEDYGFSLNPDSLFGPPQFDEAAVFLEPGEAKALTVRIE